MTGATGEGKPPVPVARAEGRAAIGRAWPGHRLRVAVVGAGVAGTFFALELHRLLPDARIELFDRDDRAPGAGVVMQQDFVERIRALHPGVFVLPADRFRRWSRILLRVEGGQIETQGHGTFGFSRRALVSHLRWLAASRPDVSFTVRTVNEPPSGFDLVVGADGAGSRLRSGLASRFGARVSSGATRFLWLSTPAQLPAMFVLKHVKEGQLIVHAYPHAERESTLVVEADPEVLDSVGLLGAPVRWIEQTLAEILSEDLDGAPVRAQTFAWRAFPTVVNEHWYRDGVALIGDAAHTVHFSSGSGTALAMEDGLSLAAALAEEPSVERAAARYAAERRPRLADAQSDGRSSQAWFESLSRQRSRSALQTAFALRVRRDMNTFAWFRENDPAFSAGVVQELARCAEELPLGTEPVDVPLTMGTLCLGNRYAVIGRGNEAGLPSDLLLGTGAADTHRGSVLCADPETGSSSPPPSPPSLPSSPPGHTCALVHGRRAEAVLELARALRRIPGLRAVGVVVPELSWLAVLRAAAPVADFYAVPSEPGVGRVLRTALAAETRGVLGLPVLLLTGLPLPLDEINTLIAAGRVDLVAAAPSLVEHIRTEHQHTELVRMEHDRRPESRQPTLEALR